MSGDPETRQPNRRSLGAYARFTAVFDEASFQPGRLHQPSEVEPGVFAIGCWESSPIVSEWHQALYDDGIIDPQSDYLSEEFAQQMRQFEADPTLLSAADLPTIRTVLTNISRGERFCDGYMASMFENGIAQAATRLLVELGSPGE